MDISKLLDNEYNNFKKKTTVDLKKNKTNLLNESYNNNLCKIGDNIYPCKILNYNNYLNKVNESKIIRPIPLQLHDNNYDNIFINKTFRDNKSCKFRGTNQHFYINNTEYPTIGIDSNGYCVLSGTHLG